MRMVLDSFPGALFPMSMLLLPEPMVCPANRPKAMLPVPLVPLRALAPNAVLFPPVEVLTSAS